MPTPSAALRTQRPDLASAFTEFDLEMNRKGFIGTEVLPVIPVAKQAGNFGKIPIEQLLQNRDTLRAPGSGYGRGSWKFEAATYATDEHGAEEPVDDREREMYGEYVDPDVYATMRARDAILMNQEKRIAAMTFNTTTWTGAALTTAVSVPWTTVATATPLADIEAAILKVYDGSGLWPNALILSRHAFRALRRCTQIIDLVKYNGLMDVRAGNVTADAIAQCFDIERLIIAGGTKNTANEGQAATLAPVWSKTMAMVCRLPYSGDFREPCIGRTFHWSGDGSQEEGQVETYREEAIRSDVVRVRHDVDEQILYAQAGHLLTAVTA